ncbi:MAG: iron-containing redox enzyme family protein [Planctomycetota bacterium]|nr:iron-containing redox enzyme family protein [Planctomycetota bacterium]
MEHESRAPQVTARADEVIKRVGVLQNSYFSGLASGEMDLECFRLTQEQFFFAVTFFPRPMAALVAKIPDPKMRLDILHNVVEEHGEFNVDEFHHTTFQRFLKSIGSDVTPLEDQSQWSLWSPVRAFNSCLTSSCVLDELEVGVACLGIQEYIFADVSAIIGKAVVENGWVAAEELVHYKLHAEIDKRHAEEMFAVVEPKWESHRYFIEQGLELGAYIFDRMFRDLLSFAERDLGRG